MQRPGSAAIRPVTTDPRQREVTGAATPARAQRDPGAATPAFAGGFRGAVGAAPADAPGAPGPATTETTGPAAAAAENTDGTLAVLAAGDPVLPLADGTLARGAAATARALADGGQAGELAALSPTGHYALAIVDARAGRVTLLTDRMGTVPLYYRIDDDRVVFGTGIDAVATGEAAGDGAADCDRQALYDYVYFHMVPAPRAVIAGTGKLRAAEYCVLAPGAAIERRRHWTPAFREHADCPRQALEATLMDTLRAAVKASLPPSGRTGAFLSGGLDSSTVAGMLAEAQGGHAQAIAIGFDAPGYDEMPWARLAATHFGVELIERYVTPDDVVAALPAVAAACDEPFGNSSILPAYFCAAAARDAGIDTLLAGDGGDELFAGNERYLPQRALRVFQALPAPLRGLVNTLVAALPGRFPLAAKARSFTAQAALDTPERLQRYNFLHRLAPPEVFADDFLAAVDPGAPLAAWRGTFLQPGGDCSELNRMLYLDWQYTLADNDLRKVSQACALAGVTVRYPMLMDALIDVSLRVPSRWKLRHGGLRAFYKAALSGWLPPQTLAKSKHGFGLPFGVWMREHRPLAELAYDTIGDLGRRGIFRETFLQRAVAMHRQGHAAYFGELVWILTVLELWLASRRDAAHGSGDA